jgi:CHAD domain-containing protein
VAGARKVEIDCEASFSAAAGRVVAVRSREVFEHADGVLDLSEIERVHDMRVATRRLRAALEVFAACFPGKPHRKALKKVKALADALGERRDADVEIELFEALAKEVTVDADRDELSSLIERTRGRQLRANEALTPYVAPRRLKKLCRRLGKLVEAVGS